MRRMSAIVLAVCAMALIASPAAAVKPDRYAEDLQDFVLEGVCAFDMQVHIVLDRSMAVDFYDRQGNLVRTQYHGSIVIQLINLETDASVDLNVGGPARDTYNSDGTVTTAFMGLGLPLATDSNATRGRFEFVYADATFSEVIGTPKASGFTQDICAMLE